MRRRNVIATAFVAWAVVASAAEPPKKPVIVDPEVLLKAINFALTGYDGIGYVYVDQAECIVSWTRPSTQPGVQVIDTFHLNNVDASRIKFVKMKSTFESEVTYFHRIELYGESVIRENSFSPSTTPPLYWDDVTLDVQTTEHDRLVRAWHYIYTHGCKSARSSF